jgi:hypothetical protein
MAIETCTKAIERFKYQIKIRGDDSDFSTSKRYGREGYQLTPHCIYLFYMRINPDGKLKVDHYYYKGDDNKIEPEYLGDLIKQMAKSAEYNGTRDERFELVGSDFENISFNRISYVVFFLDEPHWKFMKNKSDQPLIKFKKKKLGRKFSGNYSFTDACSYEIDMANPAADGESATPEKIRTAASLINHMRRKDGELIGKFEVKKYSFDIWTRVEFSSKAGGSGLTVIFDPGGDNEGPPGPPPRPG